MGHRIYMDANATTPVLPVVVDAMRPFWEERFGNASAVHSFGRSARAAIDSAREQLAKLLHGRPSEITFTSGGTESDNLALFGLLQSGDHLITGATEHDAILHAANALEQTGVQVTRVSCDKDGIIHPEAVRAAVTQRTKLVSVMLANNETGTLQPVQAIAEVAHQAGAWMHTDAVQACGKVPVNVMALDCDLLSVSAHKMHAAQGVGALWARGGVPLRPNTHGGSHERRRRAGTENVPGIVGLGKAAELAAGWLANGGSEQLCAARDGFESQLKASIENVSLLSGNVARLPNTTCASFQGVNAEELVIALDLQGLAVSGGSACQSGAIEPSHVLGAMGLSEAVSRSTVRFSMSRMSTKPEIDGALQILVRAVSRLRSL